MAVSLGEPSSSVSSTIESGSGPGDEAVEATVQVVSPLERLKAQNKSQIFQKEEYSVLVKGRGPLANMHKT